ncbi:MAG: SHOCT domain-containing protein [Oscillospiraceae bacterium]|nr:SHOCT domain-containing protein [Oscillospiraceae bacterium]
MSKKAATWILAVAIAIFGIILLSSYLGTKENPTPEKLSEVSRSDLEAGTVYLADELVVVDCFAEALNTDMDYYFILFKDANGLTIPMTMPVGKASPIRDELEAYINDSTKKPGDLVLEGYVKLEKDVDEDGKLFNFFNEALENYQAQTFDLMVRTNFRMVYVCGPEGDPFADSAAKNPITLVMGILSILGAVALLVFGVILADRTPRKKATAPAQAAPVYRSAAPQQTTAPRSIPVVPPTPAASDPVMEQLERYKSLHEAGYMTAEEYDQKRKEILGL